MRVLHELPFDQFQRYRLVADLVARLAPGREGLSVLDVGGRTALLRDFLPQHRVHLVDVEPSDEPGLVLGDGSRLPFADGAFDLVAACDTLEHVPRELREGFVRECCRVSRGYVVLAGPYDDPRVVEAEEHLRTFLAAKLDTRHRYLDEHAEHGLPSLERVTEQLQERGARVVSVGHGNLERWLGLMCLSMYMDSDAPLRAVAARYYSFYNRALSASDHAAPVYRHALVACVDDALALPSELAVPGAASEAAAQGMAPFNELLGELVAFDRERDVYEAERERLMAVNAGLLRDLGLHKEKVGVLQEDLDGHRERVAELEVTTAAQDEVIETLEEDLAGHRETLAEYAERHGEQAEVIATIERDLEEHRRTLADLQADFAAAVAKSAETRAALEQDLQEHRATLATLERDLAEHGRVVERLRAELDERSGHQAELEGEIESVHRIAEQVNAQLALEHGENQGLRAELRSRKKNLRRALSLRKPRY